jgi:hypothetical protein
MALPVVIAAGGDTDLVLADDLVDKAVLVGDASATSSPQKSCFNASGLPMPSLPFRTMSAKHLC